MVSVSRCVCISPPGSSMRSCTDTCAAVFDTVVTRPSAKLMPGSLPVLAAARAGLAKLSHAMAAAPFSLPLLIAATNVLAANCAVSAPRPSDGADELNTTMPTTRPTTTTATAAITTARRCVGRRRGESVVTAAQVRDRPIRRVVRNSGLVGRL